MMMMMLMLILLRLLLLLTSRSAQMARTGAVEPVSKQGRQPAWSVVAKNGLLLLHNL